MGSNLLALTQIRGTGLSKYYTGKVPTTATDADVPTGEFRNVCQPSSLSEVLPRRKYFAPRLDAGRCKKRKRKRQRLVTSHRSRRHWFRHGRFMEEDLYIPRTKERKPQIQGANALTKASSRNSGRAVPSGGKVQSSFLIYQPRGKRKSFSTSLSVVMNVSCCTTSQRGKSSDKSAPETRVTLLRTRTYTNNQRNSISVIKLSNTQ